MPTIPHAKRYVDDLEDFQLERSLRSVFRVSVCLFIAYDQVRSGTLPDASFFARMLVFPFLC